MASQSQTPRDGSDTSDEVPTADSSRDGRVGVLVADDCERLVRECRGDTDDDVGTTAAADHWLDPLRYACMGGACQ